jgi:hypothetical protein
MRILKLLAVSALGMLTLAQISRASVPGDEHWDVQFGAAGVSNNIGGIALKNSLLYIAGQVSVPQGTNTPLYLWDGKQWSVAAMFYGPSLMAVFDLAFVGNTLYAAGTFTNVNGVAANGLAKWDGTTWSSIGFTGIPYTLAVDGNNLYVGGTYTNAGGVTTTNIGYWDGSAWHALGNGLGRSANSFDSVRTILVRSGTVYAGGVFTNSGPVICTNIAVWNGSGWSPVGGGVNGGVLGLALTNSDLYVAGVFTQAGSTPAINIVKWDGASTWSALGTGLKAPIGGGVSSVAVFNGLVCAGGSFTNAGGVTVSNFAVWNGSTWAAPNGGSLSGAATRMLASGSTLNVGGGFAVAGNVPANFIASWDGSRWATFGTSGRLNGVQSTITALAGDGTNLYAGGLFNYAGQTNANYVARFDGTNWYPLGSGMSPLGGVTVVRTLAISSNNGYSSGSFSFSKGVFAPNIARWDGTNWNALGTGPGGVVASITIRPDGVYAAGSSLNGSLYYLPFFSRWDGANWNDASGSLENITPYVNDSNIGMDAVAWIGSTAFIGGHFVVYDNYPNGACSNILQIAPYNRSVGTGCNSNVFAMTILGNNLYVGGIFTTAGGAAANKIAAWNGSYWTNVGGSVVGNGSVLALTTVGNSLYAGGSFTNMGGVPANLIAKWDGTNWSALASGIGGRSAGLQCLGASGADLYAGGNFTVAGNKSAKDIARWNEQMNFDAPQLLGASFSGGQFHTLLSGIAGRTNIIQATTNFSTWTPVLTNSTGLYDFTESNSVNYPFRVYRAILGP